jgi:cation:H+ antiporter
MNMGWLLLQFLVCAVLICVAGFVLSRSADRLAQAYGWGRGWVGAALLATLTSLPELAAGISAVTIVESPNLAVGNALGACVVNLAFLVVVDLLQRRQPMYREAAATHLLSAGFGVIMLGLVVMSLVTGRGAPFLFHIGFYSPVLLLLYLLALKCMFRQEHGGVIPVSGHAARAGVRQQWWRFGTAALVVLGAGSWLPRVAEHLSQALGLSRSFIGTVFMALVTTLPEMAVTVAALRLGALDMAIGNLLGSNLFNVAILALDDLAYTRGPLLSDVAPVHAASAATALVMTGLVIVGLVMRPRGSILRVASWVSVGLAAAYAVNAALHYLAG